MGARILKAHQPSNSVTSAGGALGAMGMQRTGPGAKAQTMGAYGADGKHNGLGVAGTRQKAFLTQTLDPPIAKKTANNFFDHSGRKGTPGSQRGGSSGVAQLSQG